MTAARRCLCALVVVLTASAVASSQETSPSDLRFPQSVLSALPVAMPPVGDSYFTNQIGDGSELAIDTVTNVPLWTIRANAVLLHQTRLPSQALLVNNRATPQFNAHQIIPNVQGGFELDAIRRLPNVGSNLASEIRYFGVGQSTATATSSSGGSGIIYGDGNGNGLFGGRATSNVTYNSVFQSMEGNLRHDTFDNVTLLMGARYIYFADQFTSVTTNSAPSTVTTYLHGLNNLVGMQAGADVVLMRRQWFQLETVAKGGIYDNYATDRMNFSGGGPPNVGTGRVNRPAFAGESLTTFNFALSDRLSFRVGYELLWLNGVALATQQPSVNAANFGPHLATKTNDNVFYYGTTLGLQYAW